MQTRQNAKMKPNVATCEPDFKFSRHTFVLSDIHLTTAQPANPKDPLWKKFKQKEFFIDPAFEVFLKKVQTMTSDESAELILAGDIFDFDGVVELPQKKRFRTTWLERRRGLNTEERKSLFKIKLIIEHHPVFFRALSEFIHKKNKVVFIIGNHDLELHWKSVQRTILRALKLSKNEERYVRFNNWFYISNKDTLIEHGNQHEINNNCQNPINPRIRGHRKDRIRLPFGSIANRCMLNGMGYFNPHSDRTYIMSAREYLVFLFKHVGRKEPLLIWTWLWGAVVTLFLTLRESILPEVKNPLTVEDQVEEIAQHANATPRMVRELKELHAPPIITDPLGIARELWLDRVFIILIALFLGYQLLNLLNVVWKVSYWWTFGPAFLIMLPFLIFYFPTFKSRVIVDMKYYAKSVKLAAHITKVKRVIFGHTHEFKHTNLDGVEYLNSGTWSPAFDDFACTRPSCPKTFIWIRPEDEKTSRVANVYEWRGNEMHLLC